MPASGRPSTSKILKAIGITAVVVLPDHDAPGGAHALDVARHCHAAGIEARILELPGLQVKGDVSDWLAAGGTRDQLTTLAAAAPVWTPSTSTSSAIEAAPATPGTSRPAPVLLCMANVVSQPVRWLWPGRLAHGKLSIIAGDPGLGKSTITIDIAARGSAGRAWPDGAAASAPLSVLMLSAEDAPDDTIRPRLDACGADVRRVTLLTGVTVGDEERGFHLADVGALERAITETQAGLVVIDPLTAYLGGTDSHRDADVRGLLAPLAALAERTGVAVVCVMHLSKAAGRQAVYRTNGSIAFTAAARLVLAVAADPENEGRRILATVKSNIAIEAPALAYRLADGRVDWEDGPVSGVDVNALLNPAPVSSGGDQTATEQVITELLDDADLWPLDAKRAIEIGRQHGIAERTMRWAAKRLGVRIAKVGFGAAGRWLWHRPPIAAMSGNDTPNTESVAALDAVAALAIGGAFGTTHTSDLAPSAQSGNVACMPDRDDIEVPDGYTV